MGVSSDIFTPIWDGISGVAQLFAPSQQRRREPGCVIDVLFIYVDVQRYQFTVTIPYRWTDVGLQECESTLIEVFGVVATWSGFTFVPFLPSSVFCAGRFEIVCYHCSLIDGLVGTNVQVRYVAAGTFCVVEPCVVTFNCKAQAGSSAPFFSCLCWLIVRQCAIM